MSPTLHRVSPSSYETAEYEGQYQGVKIRFTRLTDRNADGGSPETRWDGLIQENGQWSLVAECFGSRRSALVETTRWIDRHPS